MSESDLENELRHIFDDKESRSTESNKARQSKKRNNRHEKKGLWRSWSPEWTVPGRMGNQYKREEDKAECLPKMQDWSVIGAPKIKHCRKGLKWHFR